MDVRVLLLAGVVVAAFFSACIAFILSVSPARTVQSAVLWIMVLFGLSMQETRVRLGDELSTSEVNFLQDAGYVSPGEEVLYFYSTGLWSIEGEGNLLTDQRVVSYEVGGDYNYFGAVAYEDIYHVDVTYAEGWAEDTSITVTTREGEEVYLVVAPEDGYDRRFVTRLQQEWRKRVPEGEEQLQLPDESLPNRAA